MFAKSNPKGMALLVHTLLCLFDQETIPQVFSVCWFPYSMVEIKEFKQIAMQVATDLAKQGLLPPGILSKAVLESA